MNKNFPYPVGIAVLPLLVIALLIASLIEMGRLMWEAFTGKLSMKVVGDLLFPDDDTKEDNDES